MREFLEEIEHDILTKIHVRDQRNAHLRFGFHHNLIGAQCLNRLVFKQATRFTFLEILSFREIAISRSLFFNMRLLFRNQRLSSIYLQQKEVRYLIGRQIVRSKSNRKFMSNFEATLSKNKQFFGNI